MQIKFFPVLFSYIDLLNKCFLIEANTQPGIDMETIYSFYQYLLEHEKFQLLLIIFQNLKNVSKIFGKSNFQISDPTNETFSYWVFKKNIFQNLKKSLFKIFVLHMYLICVIFSVNTFN
jgi:hypothetical protein